MYKNDRYNLGKNTVYSYEVWFINKNCTTEDIASTFFEDLSNVVLKDDIVLDCLELSENPTRTFIVKR